VERIALGQLLPPRGQRLLEVGAGFGRLADLYAGYQQVILLDYAKSGLREAQQRLGRSTRFCYIAADLYRLPLNPGTCDAVVTVRVLHHLVDVPSALRQFAGVLRPGGTYVLEYANKRNLKAIARYVSRRQRWSPFDPQPYEFAQLNFDFHPTWIARVLAESGFVIEAGRAVSHFRAPIFKRLFPLRLLVALDAAGQRPGAAWKLTPSVFLRVSRPGQGHVTGGGLFCCPTCGAGSLVERAEGLCCPNCGSVWGCDEGIYDFKTPIVEPDSPARNIDHVSER
jgi:SAM-dependent methyltransferase